MYDPAMIYSYPEAVRVGRALERLGYLWFEDPLPIDDMYNYAKLCAELDIAVMATEYSFGGFHGYSPWILMKATDALRGDVAIKGGISACVKAAHLADAFHMNFEIHHGGNSLNNVANLHVALAIANCDWFEVLLPHSAQKYGLVRDIEIDRETHRVYRAGRELHLGPTEFRLLEFLMQKPGRVYTRAQMLDSVWGLDSDIDERTVDVHMGRLRRAIARGKERDPIRTVRGSGYSFDEMFEKDGK